MSRTLFAFALLLVSSPGFAADSLTGKKPNIIFILTDDQGYGDLSCHGNPILKTPNLDRLHAEGVRFTDFQVSRTCSPVVSVQNECYVNRSCSRGFAEWRIEARMSGWKRVR